MSQLKTVNVNNQAVKPSKIVCVGRNYLEHIYELGNNIPDEPVIFIKPNSAISNDVLSHKQEDIHYEAELCFLIKNGIIAAVGFGLDLTKRKLQSRLKDQGLPWERAKGFDNSAVFSTFVGLPSSIANLSISLTINGKLTQQGGYSLMVNKPCALVTNINAFMTLIDNDIIMTGTPSGVGRIETGQVLKGEVFASATCLVSKQWTVL